LRHDAIAIAHHAKGASQGTDSNVLRVAIGRDHVPAAPGKLERHVRIDVPEDQRDFGALLLGVNRAAAAAVIEPVEIEHIPVRWGQLA